MAGLSSKWGRMVKLPQGIDVCRLSITPKHEPPGQARFVLEDQNDPRHYLMCNKYRYLEQPNLNHEQLGYWMIFIDSMLSRKKTVRSWARRRLQQAVCEQLRERGFDEKGLPLKGPQQLSTERSKQKHAHGFRKLVGMTEIFVSDPCVTAKYEDIKEQAGSLVDKILAVCGWPHAHDTHLSPLIRKLNSKKQNRAKG